MSVREMKITIASGVYNCESSESTFKSLFGLGESIQSKCRRGILFDEPIQCNELTENHAFVTKFERQYGSIENATSDNLMMAVTSEIAFHRVICTHDDIMSGIEKSKTTLHIELLNLTEIIASILLDGLTANNAPPMLDSLKLLPDKKNVSI